MCCAAAHPVQSLSTPHPVLLALQAVARAQATSIQSLLAKVRDCYVTADEPNGNLLAGANAYAIAVAKDVQLAIDSVYAGEGQA